MKKLLYLFFVIVGVLCLYLFVNVLNNGTLSGDEKCFLSCIFVFGGAVSELVGVLGMKEETNK